GSRCSRVTVPRRGCERRWLRTGSWSPRAGCACGSPARAGPEAAVPEGDTVYRAARKLDKALTGRVLTLSDFRVPAYATVDLVGRTVLGTIPRGKHLLTRLSSAGDSPPLTLHTHLKMEGIWQVQRPGDKWRRPTHLLRVRLAVGDRDAADHVDALGFELGVVDLAPTADEDAFVGHLGPDLLG